MINIATIGQRIRQLRREHGLAQGALGVSCAYLCRIEAGRVRRPRVETLAVIAAGLNVGIKSI